LCALVQLYRLGTILCLRVSDLRGYASPSNHHIK
jgi:hypothetical protein